MTGRGLGQTRRVPATSPSPSRLRHRDRRRHLPALVAGLALLTPLLLTAAAAPATAGPTIRRLAGTDRYATAVAVSRASYPTTATATATLAVLTTGADFPDALAGGAAAATLGGPVLLTPRDGVPSAVIDEIRRLKVSRVLVLGGTRAVSETATTQLRFQNVEVERIAGAGRYETAALVSRRTFASPAPVVYVATGADYPDALGGAAAAGRQQAPVLLVAKATLPPATAAELDRLRPARIVLLGGTGAVSTAVERGLAAYAPSVVRIAGADRYATASAVARSTPGATSAAFLATGRSFADALSGGPAAARAHAPVLLVPRSCVPRSVHNELERYGYPPVTLLGGSAALTSAVAELRPCFEVPDGALAPGVTLQTLRDPRGPWVVKVVEVDPSATYRVDTVLAKNTLAGLETTSSMARRTGALLAVNGDYAVVNSNGRPVHAFAKDGRLLQTTQLLGRNFALDSRTLTPHLGFPDTRVRLVAAGRTLPIDKVNSGGSSTGTIALTTVEGLGATAVPGSSCAARIKVNGAPTFDASGRTLMTYTVVGTACGSQPLAAGRDDVLTAPLGGTYATSLRDLTVGSVVRVSWTLRWPHVLDAIGGNPTLLEDGAVVSGNVDGTDGFSRRNPRTAVGYRSDGTVLIVTVDGRRSSSVGMSLRELADLFVRLGASDALNLDGGGSTAMVIGRELQNRPSDGYERAVSSALVLVPGNAPAASLRSGPMTSSGTSPAPEPLPFGDPRATLDAVGRDPGSTGGFEDYVRGGGMTVPR